MAALIHPRRTVATMIASDCNAVRVGSAKLVVDGTDEILVRKAEIALAPSRVQARSLEGLIAWSRDLYNGALQQRRDAWRMAHASISLFDQFNELPTLREEHPQATRFGVRPMRGALSRVDEAFAGFFRRLDAGEKAGYPRFRSARRFRSAFYDEPVSWALRGLGADGRKQKPCLYLQGVGEITLSTRAECQLRRLLERGGEPRTLTLTKTKSGAWRASIAFRGVRARRLEESTDVGGVDRGVAVTAALPDGTLLRCPDFLREARDTIAHLQRRRAEHSKFSVEWKRYNKAIAQVYRRAHHRSENWARHAAKQIVAAYGVISLEDLALSNMTRSARGTIQRPGKGVRAKQGLNRSLQDAALGRLAYWICVKAEDAGRRVYKVDPRNSSRTCAACGHSEAANRRRTNFACRQCGHRAHADVNAAQVLTARGQAADALWRAEGCQFLKRPTPHNLRRREEPAVPDAVVSERAVSSHYGAGSAPHATVA